LEKINQVATQSMVQEKITSPNFVQTDIVATQ